MFLIEEEIFILGGMNASVSGTHSPSPGSHLVLHLPAPAGPHGVSPPSLLQKEHVFFFFALLEDP